MNNKKILLLLFVFILIGLTTNEYLPETSKKGQEIFTKTLSGENGLFNPDLSIYQNVAKGLLESFQIALIGTVFAGFFSLMLGVLAAENTSPKPISGFIKFTLNAIRTIPEILLAIIFIVGVGPGAFAGILALGFHSTGTLSKLTAEVTESINKGPIEAVLAVGGSQISVFRYSALPQIMPEFVSILLYRLEINIRAASVLGMVGAGGIGKTLFFALMARNWSHVGTILIGIIIVVTLVDYISGRIRSKLV